MQEYVVLPKEIVARFQNQQPTPQQSRFHTLQNELERILKSNENDNIKMIAYTQILTQLLEEQKNLNTPIHLTLKRKRSPSPPPPTTPTSTPPLQGRKTRRAGQPRARAVLIMMLNLLY